MRSMTGRSQKLPGTSTWVRVVVWVLHVALPLLGLWLLIAEPQFDVGWEHHGAHFVLVTGAAVVNVVLGLRISGAARRRGDARLFLIALSFLSSAGFLGLHALATPQVLLGATNGGFAVATPVGLFLAAIFAAASAVEYTERGSARVLRHQRLLRGGLVALLVAWAAVSLLNLPPLASPLAVEQVQGPLTLAAVVAIALYAAAAARYFQLHRRRPRVLLVGVITAFVLLAEAMAAVVFGRNWHASWWEWHVLMLLAFGFVAYSAHVHYRREGSAVGLFNGIALAQTLEQVQQEYGQALEALVTAMRDQAERGEGDVGRLAAGLGARFGLTEGQTEVLERAASALADERRQIQRLGALVTVGQQATVILDEDELLLRVLGIVADGLAPDRVRLGLVVDGRLQLDDDLASGALAGRHLVEERRGEGATLALPLMVKDHPAGVLLVDRPRGSFADRDRAVLESLASQLSMALENARLYRQIDGLFRQYISPNVVTTLLADPAQSDLGGAVVDVTVLFADLRGFTSYSERTSPHEVVALLNRYFSVAVPAILAHGGTIMKFVGDALMAVFNVPARQPDHEVRAARAGLAMQRAIAAVVEGHPELPVFRVGVNTGPALVGNIGSAEIRDFTVIGDTVNLASRLESAAEPGTVVVGAATRAALGADAVVRSLGKFEVKGKAEPVEAFVLDSLSPAAAGAAPA